MPGAVEQQRAIVDETLQHSGRTGKIRHRQQPKTRSDHFPKAQQQSRGGKDREHGSDASAADAARRFAPVPRYGDHEDAAKENGVGPRLSGGSFLETTGARPEQARPRPAKIDNVRRLAATRNRQWFWRQDDSSRVAHFSWSCLANGRRYWCADRRPISSDKHGASGSARFGAS